MPAPHPLFRRVAASIAILLTSVAGMPRAEARPSQQTLALDAVPPLPPLRGESVTRSVSEILRSEIDQLAGPSDQPAEPLGVIVRQARLTYRRFAFDLLARSAGGEGPSDLLAMHGFRLADARRRVDLRLERVIDGSGTRSDGSLRPLPVREKDRIGRLLQRFVEVAPKALASGSLADPAQLDAAVGVAIEPLLDALAIIEERATGDDLGSGWPTADEVGAAPRGATVVAASQVAGDPCDEASLAGVGPATGAALRAHCLSERRDEPERMEAASTAHRLSRAALAASWLDANQRAALDQRAAELLSTGGSRGLLRAQAVLIEARSRLLAAEGPKPETHAELDAAIALALFPAVERGVALADSPAELGRVIQRMAESVELGASARGSERATPPKEFRTAQRDAERRYKRVEATTWAKLTAMLADDEALTNPEQLTVVREQRESLRDLDRIAAVQPLIDSIGGVRPQAMRGLSARLRMVVRWLGEPTRRADALAIFDTLELHVRLFVPLPYERELREGGEEALAFTAGRAAELVQFIDLSRAEWADAWATGNATGPAAQRMVQLHRLTRAMADLSQGNGGPESRDAAASLSRWGAFHATRAALAPAMVDVRAMVQLATAALLGRDATALERELARIERDAPLARLVGRLARDLEPWLATRPGDVLGQLVAIRLPPASNAWGLPLRPRLAAILRTARELDFARREGRVEDERALLGHLSALARVTLESLANEPSALPPLAPME